jgi:hypothetical protein
MTELERLRTRKKRRQAALQTLGDVDDKVRTLQSSLKEILLAVQDMQAHPLRYAVRPGLRRQALAVIAGSVEAIRGEFHSLAHSDERELEALLDLQQSLNKPHF